VAADELEHFEQSRAHRLARDGDARRVNQGCGLDAARLGKLALGLLERAGLERL